jgi:hypothetical protein
MSERMKSEEEIKAEYRKILEALKRAEDGSFAQKILAQRGTALLWVLGLLGDKSLAPNEELLELLNVLR